MTQRQIQTKRKKVEAGLLKLTYCGWGGESEFLQMSWKTFVNWCCGRILVGIGANEFHSTVQQNMQMTLAWETYQEKKKELEKQLGLDKVSSLA